MGLIENHNRCGYRPGRKVKMAANSFASCISVEKLIKCSNADVRKEERIKRTGPVLYPNLYVLASYLAYFVSIRLNPISYLVTYRRIIYFR